MVIKSNLYAEELPYWQTSKSSPDTWIDRAVEIIEKLGGEVNLRAMGTLAGRSAFILLCKIGGEQFRIAFPVMPNKFKGGELAAKRQAATMLYHDVKARSISAVVLGTRSAFASFLMLPDGRTISEVSNQELIGFTSGLFLGAGNVDYVDGEIVEE